MRCGAMVSKIVKKQWTGMSEVLRALIGIKASFGMAKHSEV